MSLKVRFSPEAKGDLEAIKAYIARDNPAAADFLVLRIRKLMAILSGLPLLGKLSEEVDNVYKIPVRKSPYLIVYEIRPTELWIVRVYHDAREDLHY